MPKIADVLRIVSRLAPETLAEEWDNVGLQVGSVERSAHGVIIALDADLALLEKAREVKANIAITHHPLIYSPLKRLNLNTPVGKILERAVLDGIAIYSAHTNLDIVAGGVGDTLADKIGLINKGSFSNFGRIGEISVPASISEIAERIKTDFSIPSVTVVGESGRVVRKIAVCGGSGGSLIRDAVENGAELLVTGDIKYHAAKDAEAYGIAVIDMGHFASESIILPILASWIKGALEEEGIKIGVHIHEGNDPLRTH